MEENLEEIERKEKADEEERDLNINGCKNLVYFMLETTETDFKKSVRKVIKNYKSIMVEECEEDEKNDYISELLSNYRNMNEIVMFYNSKNYYEYSEWVDFFEEPSKIIERLKKYTIKKMPKSICDKVIKEVFESEGF